MSAQFDERALHGARVRFRSMNDVIEGRVDAVGHHLVVVVDDNGDGWKVARQALFIVEDEPHA
jgi:hypothetical protein